MKVPALLLLGCTMTTLASCSGTIPLPTVMHAEYASRHWPGTRLEDLIKGRELYVLKCSGCHSLHAPTELTAVQWEKTVPEMMTRARLSKEEAILILRYLASASEAKNK